MPHKRKPALSFVDDKGGAFAALAAAIVGAHGRQAFAFTTVAPNVPGEIDVVLTEIGASPRGALPLVPGAGESIDVSAWGHPLFHGEGELEKLALARIARDRIELRVEALLSGK
jgi:hypothetical protein